MSEPARAQSSEVREPQPNQAKHRRVQLAAGLYLAVLLTATHWPGVEIHGPIERPDLWIHAGAYGLLTALAAASGIFGRGRWAVWLAGLAALAIAGLDEITQPWPPFHRHAAFDDWLADAAGIVIVAIGWSLLRLRKTSA